MILQVHAVVHQLCPKVTAVLETARGGQSSVPWFLVLCWLMIKTGAWGGSCLRYMHSAAHSFPHLLRLIPVPPPVSLLSQPNAFTVEVVAMKYRIVIQKMNKCRQLDLARVNIFRDIESMVRSMFTAEDDTQTVTSATTRTTTVVDTASTVTGTTLKAHAMSRLLDNLWLTAELVDSSYNSNGAPKRGTARPKISGVETLRTEYDSLKEHLAYVSRYTASECSFLKWAGAAVPVEPMESSAHILPLSPKNGPADLSQPIKPLPVPDYANHTSKNAHYNSGHKSHDEMLDKAVFEAIPMMGSMEECILELLDNGNLSFSELCAVSGGIDKNFSSLGITVEEIDKYCEGLDHGEDNMAPENHTIFETLDSLYCNDTTASGLHAATPAYTNALYNHLQQQLGAPITSNEVELNNLRELHGSTMMRTANVCSKFCPYEIAWSKEALQQFT